VRVVRLALPEVLLQHLEAEYPREGCGLILRRGDTGPYRIRPMRNDREPPHAHTAFAFNPNEWLQANLEADAHNERILCVYHSHVDTGAHFSSQDREWAAPEGVPVLPGVSYLVVSITGGRASEARLFAWKDGGFHELPGVPYCFTNEKAF
jgi:proteasome lid subunit RPN8/RPN11